MSRFILTSLSLLLFTVFVRAQETQPARVLGHAFFGAGGAIADGNAGGVLHVGGGGEGLIYKGLGAGAEIGYLFPRESAGDGLGILSANGFYRFLHNRGVPKVAPFVTAGYSLGFRSGTANLVNFGGGMDTWLSDRVGLRLEVRDHVWPADAAAHFLVFRFGLVAR